MAKINRCTYYFELLENRNGVGIDSWKTGTYSAAGYMGAWFVGRQSRLALNSDMVWCQGPRGGVKIVKDRINYPGSMYGYVTNNEKLMKEFMWIKLKAKEIKN